MFIKPGEVVEQRERESMQEFTIRIEKAAIHRSLENLMTFPFVRTLVEKGALNLHGAYFGVAEGSLFLLDQAAKEFHSVREEPVSRRAMNRLVHLIPLFEWCARGCAVDCRRSSGYSTAASARGCISRFSRRPESRAPIAPAVVPKAHE